MWYLKRSLKDLRKMETLLQFYMLVTLPSESFIITSRDINIMSTLTYGAETWTGAKTDTSKLTADMSFVNYIMANKDRE